MYRYVWQPTFFKNLRENISGMWELCMVQWEMKNLNLSEDYKDEKEALYYYTDDSVAMVFP